MNPKYQIFISSTFKDLIEQRNRVVETVLRMSHLPVGMEIFNSAAKTPWDVIKSHIDNSDYYIVILAHRYGSEAPDGIGYTEKEYDYAMAKGIPCLGFVLKAGVQWNPEWTESKPATKKKLEAFKRKIEANHVTYWTNPDELASQVLLGLTDTIRDTPGIGWVRATEANSPQVAGELARLSKENNELKIQLEASSETDEIIQLLSIIENTYFSLVVKDKKVDFSLARIFKSNLYESEELEMYEAITEGDNNFSSYKVFRSALRELRALGLIYESNSTPNSTEWLMTEKGNKVYARIRQGKNED